MDNKVIAVFPDGVSVIEMREFSGNLYVATTNGVYIVSGNVLKPMKLEE